MKNTLIKKLKSSSPYQHEEIVWLLKHIGHPDPAVRDQLVYANFCHGLLDQLISSDDFDYLIKTSRQKNLLFEQVGQINQASLTRSFTALLYALMLFVDQDDNSPYYQQLDDDDRTWLFQSALTYLELEKDSRGYDDKFGWIHCSAHAAEFLYYASNHDLFPKQFFEQIFPKILQHFKRQKSVFSAGEERRWAWLVANLIIKEKLKATELCKQLEAIDLVEHETRDYFTKLNIDNFLASLYFRLKMQGKLDQQLQNLIEKHWENAL